MIIAIDPGVKNGIAVYDRKQIIRSGEFPIWDVFEMLQSQAIEIKLVLLEDARLNFRPDVSYKDGIARAQGAGWIKILSGQYEDFLIKFSIPYKLIKPSRKWTKQTKEFVELQTGIATKQGEQNRRDALMMLKIYGI